MLIEEEPFENQLRMCKGFYKVKQIVKNASESITVNMEYSSLKSNNKKKT